MTAERRRQEAEDSNQDRGTDRRGEPRFAAHLRGDETIEIWQDPARPITASVVDESINGVGVLVDHNVEVRVEQVIEVVYRGVRRRAMVQNLATLPDGRRIGLRWRHRPC